MDGLLVGSETTGRTAAGSAGTSAHGPTSGSPAPPRCAAPRARRRRSRPACSATGACIACERALGERLGREPGVGHRAVGAVVGEPPAHVDELLEVALQREAEERPPRRDQLHAVVLRPPCTSARSQHARCSKRLCTYGPHLEALDGGEAPPARGAARPPAPGAAPAPASSCAGNACAILSSRRPPDGGAADRGDDDLLVGCDSRGARAASRCPRRPRDRTAARSRCRRSCGRSRRGCPADRGRRAARSRRRGCRRRWPRRARTGSGPRARCRRRCGRRRGSPRARRSSIGRQPTKSVRNTKGWRLSSGFSW